MLRMLKASSFPLGWRSSILGRKSEGSRRTWHLRRFFDDEAWVRLSSIEFPYAYAQGNKAEKDRKAFGKSTRYVGSEPRSSSFSFLSSSSFSSMIINSERFITRIVTMNRLSHYCLIRPRAEVGLGGRQTRIPLAEDGWRRKSECSIKCIQKSHKNSARQKVLNKIQLNFQRSVGILKRRLRQTAQFNP